MSSNYNTHIFFYYFMPETKFTENARIKCEETLRITLKLLFSYLYTYPTIYLPPLENTLNKD